MTKVEVQKKIRYNENLVAQYRDAISRLQSQIYELERLRTKFQSLQYMFECRQNDRKRKLFSVYSARVNLKFVSTYITGMSDLLSGSECIHAYNGLSVAQDRINSQIGSIQSEISDNYTNLNYRQGRINYWKSQLRYATDN
ncbi:MAG: DUF5082 domain-containing protein [Lachnospiraceae bacterium]|nr:DUF5082 domain-containing protein [Lachnospiraceae bacterium]